MTRANVILKKEENEVYLYRHCDGYPERLGKDLEEAIDSTPEDTIFNILKISGIEIASSIHGDIEYLYTINFNDEFITLTVKKL